MSASSSRFQDLGLNRTKQSRKHKNEDLSLDRPDSECSEPGDGPSMYQRKWMQGEEDTFDMEDLNVPEALQIVTRFERREPPSTPPPSNDIKKSQYTTGILTVSGWNPINKPVQNEHDGSVQPLPLSTKEQRVDEGLDKELAEDSLSPAQNEVIPDPWDEKYFEHHGYLRYLHGTGEKPDEETPSLVEPNAAFTKPDVQRNKASVAVVPKPKSQVYTAQSDEQLSQTKNTALGGIRGLQTDNLGSEVAEEQTNPPAERIEVDEPPVDPETVEPNDGGAIAGADSTEPQAVTWKIVDGNTDGPRKGEPAPEMLVVRLRNSTTQDIKTLTFSNISHDEIDWNKQSHLDDILKWRSQIFRSHGLATKRVSGIPFHPDEDAWLMLFHQKIKAVVEAGIVVKVPGKVPIMNAFNAFFEGRILHAEGEEDAAPRPARTQVSISNKMHKKDSDVWKLRDVTRKLLEGKRDGKLYVPVITEEALRQYRRDGTVAVDDPKDESQNLALGAESTKSRQGSPKRKRELSNDGNQNVKRTRETR